MEGERASAGAIDGSSGSLTPNCIYIDYGDFEHARVGSGLGRGLLCLPETKISEEWGLQAGKSPKGHRSPPDPPSVICSLG